MKQIIRWVIAALFIMPVFTANAEKKKRIENRQKQSQAQKRTKKRQNRTTNPRRERNRDQTNNPRRERNRDQTNNPRRERNRDQTNNPRRERNRDQTNNPRRERNRDQTTNPRRERRNDKVQPRPKRNRDHVTRTRNRQNNHIKKVKIRRNRHHRYYKHIRMSYRRNHRNHIRSRWNSVARRIIFTGNRRSIHDHNRWRNRHSHWWNYYSYFRPYRPRYYFRVVLPIPYPDTGSWRIKEVRQTADAFEHHSQNLYFQAERELSNYQRDDEILTSLYDVVRAAQLYSSAAEQNNDLDDSLYELFYLEEKFKKSENQITNLSGEVQESFEWMNYYLGELLYTYRNYSDTWETERPWDSDYSGRQDEVQEDEYYDGDYYESI